MSRYGVYWQRKSYITPVVFLLPQCVLPQTNTTTVLECELIDYKDACVQLKIWYKTI